MILVCGGLADTVTELVCARLDDCGYAYRLLDLTRFPAGFRVCWEWRGARPEPDGYVAGDDWRVEMRELSGIYVRYLGAEGRLPRAGLEPAHAAAAYFECDSALMVALEHLPCVVVNRLWGGMSNNSKPYQALAIRRCGLLTPPTLVTSDPRAAQQFYEECGGEVIYKSLSGVRSIVHRVNETVQSRFPLLRDGAAQFQRFIPGENVRVHTVGDEVIATRVRTEAVDYRYARTQGYDLEMEPAELPTDVARACQRLSAELDLEFAGIDLKETPDGEYYCFEVNPSPGFLFYEQGSGQGISTALARLLQHGRGTPAPPAAPLDTVAALGDSSRAAQQSSW